MIAYIDSSMLARAYLSNEDGNAEAVSLLTNAEIALVTGTWTRMEVSGALTRAAQQAGVNASVLHGALDSDLDPEHGSVREVRVAQDEVERLALRLTRARAIRAMDAWHLACAAVLLPQLAEADEVFSFATRDTRQADVARTLGFELV